LNSFFLEIQQLNKEHQRKKRKSPMLMMSPEARKVIRSSIRSYLKFLRNAAIK
jgi:hypothetical protein